MGLFSKVSRFARSSAGRKVTDMARQQATNPATRRKLTDLAGRLRGRSGRRPGGPADPGTGGTPPAV